MKIVRNNDYGGFGLSPTGVVEYAKLKGFEVFAYKEHYPNGNYLDKPIYKKINIEDTKNVILVHYSTKDYGDTCTSKEINSTYFAERNIPRDDKALVEVVEKLGKKANGIYADLIVVEIPDDIEWEITDYDGWESVEEVHRSW